MNAVWEDIFTPAPIPEWLLLFDKDPSAAIDDLLWGRYYFGHLNVSDPKELLIEWAFLFGEEENFSDRLDNALKEWVVRNWGKIPSASSSADAARLAIAWCRLADVVGYVVPWEELLKRYTMSLMIVRITWGLCRSGPLATL